MNIVQNLNKNGNNSEQKELVKLEQKCKKFVEDFPLSKIKDLTLDEYVIGLENNRNTFCYRLELELQKQGNMRGTPSTKFGVWYGKRGNETTQEYRCTKKFSKQQSIDEALENVKSEIVNLLEAGKDSNKIAIEKSNICDLFKWKLLSVYYPEKYIPIFNIEHLYYFLDSFGIEYDADTEKHYELQIKLIEWKNSYSETEQMSNLEFMRVLYKYNHPNIAKQNQIADYELNDKVNNSPDKKNNTDQKVSRKRKHSKKSSEHEVYPRDVKTAKKALALADHKCEFDPEHKSFARASDGKNYTEPHHLIPMSQYDDFKYSIDNHANIVSLCSECHNKIHYGRDKEELIRALYELRKDQLTEAGIPIELDKLLKIYGVKTK